MPDTNAQCQRCGAPCFYEAWIFYGERGGMFCNRECARACGEWEPEAEGWNPQAQHWEALTHFEPLRLLPV